MRALLVIQGAYALVRTPPVLMASPAPMVVVATKGRIDGSPPSGPDGYKKALADGSVYRAAEDAGLPGGEAPPVLHYLTMVLPLDRSVLARR